MKVIITGSTGTVGSGVLQEAVANKEVTSIVALTRRPLDIKDPKLNNIIQTDYTKYDKSVVDQLRGAEACIWALGSPSSGKAVHVDYTMTAVNTFLASVVPQLGDGKCFRFVYTSGGLVPYLESNALFFLGNVRKVRADLDREILAVEKQNAGRWESFVARPWFVVDAKPTMGYIIENSWIPRNELGAAMVDAALHGNDQRVLDNATMRADGQAALKKQNR